MRRYEHIFSVAIVVKQNSTTVKPWEL